MIVNKIRGGHNVQCGWRYEIAEEEADVRAQLGSPRTSLIRSSPSRLQTLSEVRAAGPARYLGARATPSGGKRENKVHINFCVAPANARASARRHLIV